MLCSISTVYRAVCTVTQQPVIIKAYQKAKMKEKNFLRMDREVWKQQHCKRTAILYCQSMASEKFLAKQLLNSINSNKCINGETRITAAAYLGCVSFPVLTMQIRLMVALDGDPSIVQLYTVFEDRDFKYLIMEVCKGGDLFKAMLLCGGKMDERWVCAEVLPWHNCAWLQALVYLCMRPA